MMKIRNVGAHTQKKWRPGGAPLEGRGSEGWSPEEWGPEGSGTAAWGLEGWGPEGGGPKISRFFFPLPLPFSLFLSLSLGGLLVEIWWCLKCRDP